jgi:hypothetical protein
MAAAVFIAAVNTRMAHVSIDGSMRHLFFAGTVAAYGG